MKGKWEGKGERMMKTSDKAMTNNERYRGKTYKGCDVEVARDRYIEKS